MKRFLYILLFTFPLAATAQQLPQYGLYLFQSQVVNPAQTGTREHWYFRTYYNRHWLNVGTPGYFNASVDGSLTDRLNLGIFAVNEQMGLANITDFALSYAYRINMGLKESLSFGLSLGWKYHSVSSNFDPVIKEDPSLKDFASTLDPLINLGMYYESDVWWGGLSARNLAAMSVQHENVAMLLPQMRSNYVLTLGGFVPAADNIDLVPSVMWQEDFKYGSLLDFTIGAVYNYDYRGFISFRVEHPMWKSADVIMNAPLYAVAVGAEAYLSRFTVSYTYTQGLNSFVSGYLGEHEISIGYYISYRLPHRGRVFHFKKYTDYCPTCY
jgi:type IX secretion system PorP/SprF family membrane protein